jgi:hypothetical protein
MKAEVRALSDVVTAIAFRNDRPGSYVAATTLWTPFVDETIIAAPGRQSPTPDPFHFLDENFPLIEVESFRSDAQGPSILISHGKDFLGNGFTRFH